MDRDPDPATPPVEPGRPDSGDLDAIATDLAEVETAMRRIEDGTYWSDEVTGEPLDEELLAERPTARSRPSAPSEPPASSDP